MRKWLVALFVLAFVVSAKPNRASAGRNLVVGHDSWIGYAGVFVADATGY
jgi:hypothetical protein